MNNKSLKIPRTVFKTCLAYFIIIFFAVVIIKMDIGGIGILFVGVPLIIAYVSTPFVLMLMIFSGIYLLINRKRSGLV